ncbi:MAG: ATP-binding protein, partial [Acidimicrobiales bacterium]
MRGLPSGTLTFLFTDIESSSARWESDPAAMSRALVEHDRIINETVAEHDGVTFKHTGDGICAAFPLARQAVAAAIAAQRRLQTQPWVDGERLLVRMGLHTGAVEPRDDDYFGPVVNRAARVMGVANGDQIALSAGTAGLIDTAHLRDEGDHDLRGIGIERICLAVDADLLVDPRPLRRPATSIRNLPVILTSLVGREHDIDQVGALVGEHRLVTLVGAGGVGKTRLAVEAAARLADSFGGGVRYCELAPVNDGEAVAEAVAEAVGARRQPGLDVEASIADYVDGRSILLVLDNCEHVLDVTRRLVEGLLDVDGVSLLLTSREPLDVAGEQVVSVEPLTDPADGVDLFVDRARERDIGFTRSPENEADLQEICRRLDGIPLAIELAAARVRVLAPEQLVKRLDDRFAVLKGRRHGDRQQTLRETVQWSYDLLDPTEQALFERLSVFVGGFTLAAVEAVCAGEALDPVDVVEVLDALVDKSMVVSDRRGGAVRFAMLETLRQFAAEQLGEDADVGGLQRRHEDYYAAIASRQGEVLFTVHEDDAWAALGIEWDNIRAAFESARDRGSLGGAIDIVLSVAWFATFSIRSEAFSWADELLAVEGVDQEPDYGSLLGAAAMGAYLQVGARAEELAEAGLLHDPGDRLGFCRTTLCAVYLNNVHRAEASDAVTREWLEHLDEAVPASRLWASGFRTFHLATYGGHELVDQARTEAATLTALATEMASPTAKALAFWAEGLATSVTDPDEAAELWQLGQSEAYSLSDEHLLGHLLIGLQLHFVARRGQLPEVLALCRFALAAALDQHYFVGTSHLFGVAAIGLARSGDARTAGRLLGAM